MIFVDSFWRTATGIVQELNLKFCSSHGYSPITRGGQLGLGDIAGPGESAAMDGASDVGLSLRARTLAGPWRQRTARHGNAIVKAL